MSLKDRINDLSAVQFALIFSALLGSIAFGGSFGLIKLMDKNSLKHTNFEIKEASVLEKFSEQNIVGNRRYVSTDYDYRFILDIDEDGVYNKNKDVVISGDNLPYYLLEKDNRIVYLEKSYKGNVRNRIPLIVKDKEEKSHLISEVEDIYSVKFWSKSESFNKANQLFKDEYMNQR